MKVIKPSVEFITPLNGEAVMQRLELCGRVCYKSENKITNESSEKFIAGIIQRGHESVLEHCSLTVKFICDRGVSHEIVRHRLASYSQESTRYCNYNSGRFDGEITVIEPCFWDRTSAEYAIWKRSCLDAEKQYKVLVARGATPQEARTILPNSLKTEVVMTANIREWRHFLRLRCDKAAHPQMREIATQVLDGFYNAMPALFKDIMIEQITSLSKTEEAK